MEGENQGRRTLWLLRNVSTSLRKRELRSWSIRGVWEIRTDVRIELKRLREKGGPGAEALGSPFRGWWLRIADLSHLFRQNEDLVGIEELFLLYQSCLHFRCILFLVPFLSLVVMIMISCKWWVYEYNWLMETWITTLLVILYHSAAGFFFLVFFGFSGVALTPAGSILIFW
jgi:hypothetical protein